MARQMICLSVVALVSACAASGPSYREVIEGAEPVGSDLARIVFLRPTDRDDGSSGGPAAIRVNDDYAGALQYGGFFYVDTAPGAIVLLASGRYRTFGACEIVVEAPAGSTLYIDVGPRTSYMVAGAIGGVIGAAAGASAVGSVFASAGEAIAQTTVGVAAGSAAGSAAAATMQSGGKRCGGPYRLELISEDSALPCLEQLVWSK